MPLSGSSNLPVASRNTPWDAAAAKRRVFAACGDNVACISRAFLWRSSGDARSPDVWSMGYCDYIDGKLHIIPRGIAVCAGKRGVGSFSGSEQDAGLLRARITSIYDRVRTAVADWPESPFSVVACIRAAAGGDGFEGPIAFEGVATGDGRFIEKGALSWDEGPWPLVFDRAEMDHSGATIGAIDAIERRSGGVIWASGNLSETEDPETGLLVLRAAELFEEGAVGVSISLDDVEDNVPDDPEKEWPKQVKVLKARIRSVAVVDEAAFSEAKLALVAAADPVFFANPGFGNGSLNPQNDGGDERLVWQEPERPEEESQYGCPLTVTEDGHVYGHAALWGRCHVGFPGTCVRPPKEPAAYRGYLTGERVPGIPSGPLVFKTRHAPDHLSADMAAVHYAHTGYAPADVTIGPDAYGIWVSGALRPDATEAEVEMLRASALSGDWRLIGGRHKLVGILAVNAPGFRVARALAASGALITVGPGCVTCDEQASLEDRLSLVEQQLADALASGIGA